MPPDMDTPTTARPGTNAAVEERIARVEGDMKLLKLTVEHQGVVMDLRLKPIETDIKGIMGSIKSIEELITRALRGDPTLIPGQAEQLADWKNWRTKVDSSLEDTRDDKLTQAAVNSNNRRLLNAGWVIFATILACLASIGGGLIAHILIVSAH